MVLFGFVMIGTLGRRRLLMDVIITSTVLAKDAIKQNRGMSDESN